MEAIRNLSKSKTSNAAGDIAIVTRISLERLAVTGTWYEVRSRLMHKSKSQFYLVEEPHEPGGREVATLFSRKQAIDWLSDHPARHRGVTAAEREG
jgi:hypothetical protein